MNVEQSGELSFQFIDGLSIFVTVFRASDYTGTPCETDEAKPIWVGLNDIPYSKMWKVDEYWFPYMLERKPFRGYFIYDGDDTLDYNLVAD